MSKDAPAIDPLAFRSALGAFATGVTIVTASSSAQGGDVGVTASSFNSVSLDPPMVLWSLARKSGSLATFMDASHFCVHVLAADQEDLSNRFARGGTDKFAGLEPRRGAGNVPLLEAAAHFECRTVHRYDGGDHIIFVGEVEDFRQNARAPLLFHQGKYALAARKSGDLSAQAPVDSPAGGFGENFLGYLLGRAHFQLYARMAPTLDRLGLTLADHFALSVLGISGPANDAAIEAAMGYTGHHFTPEQAASMEAGGLIHRDGAGTLHLSDLGREHFIALSAVGLATEEDLLDLFDEQETALLRNLLKRAIKATDPGLPDIWLPETQ